MKIHIMKIIWTSFVLLFTLTFSGCGPDENYIGEFPRVQNDFFCEESGKGVFVEFEIDEVPIRMNMCDLSAAVADLNTSKSVRQDTLYSQSIDISGSLGEERFDISFHGFFYSLELDVSNERAYAQGVFGNDLMEFAEEDGFGSELYTLEEGKLIAPEERPSYVTISYRKSNSAETLMSTEVSFVPGEEVEFQKGSFMKIDLIEEIDYQNPDFDFVSYNYIIEGTFECQLYNDFKEPVNIKKGKFRLPFKAATTAELYNGIF